MKVQSEFSVKSWDEAALDAEKPGSPIKRVSAVFALAGEMDGTMDVEYLMHYKRQEDEDPHNGEARYAGFLTFCGSISGKSGSFALEDSGVFVNSAPASKLSVIPYSGSGGFAGMTGFGRYFADNGKMMIELEFPDGMFE